MEIYDNEEKQTTSYKSKTPKKDFFPRSELNDWLPLWEKIVFFLIGYLGINLFSFIVQRILFATPLAVFKNGVFLGFTTLGSVLINFFTYFLLVASFLLFLFFDRRKTYKRFFAQFKSKSTYLYGLIGFGCILAFQLILGNIYQATIPFYGSNSNQSGIEEMTKAYPILLFIMTVFFAPFVEELTYRIGIVDTIGHKYKYRWLGIIFSALIFGAIHANLFSAYVNFLDLANDNTATAELIQQARIAIYNEWLNLPIYIGSGFLLGLTYAKSGKISASFMAHMGVNLFSMVVTIIQNSLVK